MRDIRTLDLKKHYYNLSYDEFFQHETSSHLGGLARGKVTKFGAVAVDTGRFTGRSPKDKFIVAGGPSSSHIWWANEKHKGSDNKPAAIESWDAVYDLIVDHLWQKKLYITDGWVGADSQYRIKVRVITPIAWQAHFAKNIFIRPIKDEKRKEVDWFVLCASEVTIPNWQELGLNSEIAIIINFEKKTIVICGTWYAGEIKKAMFSVMNYLLPLKGVGSFHCSANQGKDGDTALFFGLSGTGKTTLSADPNRYLIGDDEHGWGDKGIFNLEGGCYAKVINLSKEKEPDIYQAIKKNALLENVVVDKKGQVDFSSSAKTENTRVSYPLYHIKNIVEPSIGPHPKTIIFLTCDSFGVLPPVAKLNEKQSKYWYLSGYTAKIAGTERGITEPVATFSSCFGAPFLTLHPTVYADILGEKIAQHQSKVYLVNTGWIGGSYGEGERINIPVTRQIVNEILSGGIDKAGYEKTKPFSLMVPRRIKGVDSNILKPRDNWFDKDEYDKKAIELAKRFIDNFKKFTDTPAGKEIEKAGPILS